MIPIVSKRYYVHGTSYVDRRLMMFDLKDAGDSDDEPYYDILRRKGRCQNALNAS